ncbi:hypothetical protein BH18VER1_BH18VER1_02400 [soil metagenome]
MKPFPARRRRAAAGAILKAVICLCAAATISFWAWTSLFPGSTAPVDHGWSDVRATSLSELSDVTADRPMSTDLASIPDSLETLPARLQEDVHMPSSPPPLDDKRWGELRAALSSGPVDDQVEAVRLFGRVGTPEEKEKIVEYARDTTRDAAVRVAAIENIDWDQQLDLIGSLVRSDSDVAEAIIYIAVDKELSPQSVAVLTESVSTAFSPVAQPSLQLAVLHFLAERGSDRFGLMAAQATSARYSQTELDDLAQLLAVYEEKQEFLSFRE